MLFALKTVKDLESVLNLPPAVCEDLRQKNSNDDEYKKQLIRYWLRTSIYASWSWLSGRLLFLEENVALQKVQKKIKHDLGTYVHFMYVCVCVCVCVCACMYVCMT